MCSSDLVLMDGARVGSKCRIFPGAVISAIPQDLKFAGERTTAEVGDGSTIRECVTINRGTADREKTAVGSNCLLLAYVHLAHDCIVGSHTIFANNSQLAGHVEVGDWVILGGFTVVHQFVRLGAHAMTAMCSMLLADLPPFVMCQGQPASARSMNYEGLRRRGFSAERISAVKAMHKALYRDELTLVNARGSVANLAARFPEAASDVAMMDTFLEGVNAQRGIVR